MGPSSLFGRFGFGLEGGVLSSLLLVFGDLLKPER
jgi:hypothetical protein